MADRTSLDHAKVEAAIGNRALVEFGLATGLRASLGHTSMRVPGDPDKFVVKGRGYRLDVLSRIRPEDMVLCDLEGNWLDGPAYSSQCSEVKIHSSIYQARPDVLSVTHVHPDYAVLISVFQKPLVPMAQEGAGLVLKPIPVFPQTKVVTTDAEGRAVAELLGDGDALLLLGHGAVTVSTRSVERCVLSMVELEHQARLNYLAMCAGGLDHPRIPDELARAVSQRDSADTPHLEARRSQVPAGGPDGGLWADLRAKVEGTW
jgi:ribulose-5-phosphate 4-epimerase/fuculose-1-phosphate aldolase